MIVKEVYPRIVTLELRQEKTDPDYGSCMWAVFNFDLDRYDLHISSDCGSYSYGWVPTPKSESFLHLIGRMDQDYFLDKIASARIVDTEETFKKVKEYLDDVIETETASTFSKVSHGLDEYEWECIESACNCSNEYECLGALEEVLKSTELADSYDRFDLAACIEMTYTANAKKIAEVFGKYIRPAARELDARVKRALGEGA